MARDDTGVVLRVVPADLSQRLNRGFRGRRLGAGAIALVLTVAAPCGAPALAAASATPPRPASVSPTATATPGAIPSPSASTSVASAMLCAAVDQMHLMTVRQRAAMTLDASATQVTELRLVERTGEEAMAMLDKATPGPAFAEPIELLRAAIRATVLGVEHVADGVDGVPAGYADGETFFNDANLSLADGRRGIAAIPGVNCPTLSDPPALEPRAAHRRQPTAKPTAAPT